jgi:hypothetical protein
MQNDGRLTVPTETTYIIPSGLADFDIDDPIQVGEFSSPVVLTGVL